MNRKIAVLGLGYTGLPLALAFARAFPATVGFDINTRRVSDLKKGIDFAGLGLEKELLSTSLTISDQASSLEGANFFVVSVPTPVDENKKPDLSALVNASKVIAKYLTAGALVVYESTVYPGVTEDVCGAVLENVSGLKRGKDFKLGYSPERINPGDQEHTLDTVTKVISAEDDSALEQVFQVYRASIKAPLYKATSIKVAEAAKVIENTQRDLNIALMNELSIIFDRIGIRTKDVLDAAGTKWNFLKFTPGLVGGHCIGVDPFYLTSKAEQLGYYPEVILAGRRINDEMGFHIARKAMKLMAIQGIAPKTARVGVVGMTFKENVPDVRNSRVPDIISELKEFGVHPIVYDPVAEAHVVKEEFQIELSPFEKLGSLDVLILAVPHKIVLENDLKKLLSSLKSPSILIDVKSVVDINSVSERVSYWSL